MTHISLFFFFNDTATTEIYTLSLHDALPIWHSQARQAAPAGSATPKSSRFGRHRRRLRAFAIMSRVRCGNPKSDPVPSKSDRKSQRLNSRHSQKSYAVFCLKKKNSTCQLHCT